MSVRMHKPLANGKLSAVSLTHDEVRESLPKKPGVVFDEVVGRNDIVEALVLSPQVREAMVVLQDRLLFLRWSAHGAGKAALALFVPFVAVAVMASTHKNGTGHLEIPYRELSKLVVHKVGGGCIVEAQSPHLPRVNPRLAQLKVGRQSNWNAVFVPRKLLEGCQPAFDRVNQLIQMAAPTALEKTSGSQPDLAEQLERLASLADSGALSEEEFNAAKSRILSAQGDADLERPNSSDD